MRQWQQFYFFLRVAHLGIKMGLPDPRANCAFQGRTPLSVRSSVEGTVTDEVVSCLQSAAVCKSSLVELGFDAADTGVEAVKLDRGDGLLALA